VALPTPSPPGQGNRIWLRASGEPLPSLEKGRDGEGFKLGKRPPPERRVRRGSWAKITFIFTPIIIMIAAICWVVSLGPVPLGHNLDFSTVVLDRDGRLLRPYLTREGRWRLPASLPDVDSRLIDAVIAYEDKRFWTHRGVDLRALLRATGQLIASGHIVSGASTLTMQVARLLEPRHQRTFFAKLREIVRAFELEAALTKQQILSLYLDLAPYGGNLEGVRAAALAYFGREPRRLDLAEIALLVALPQSPELRRPDRSLDTARRARARVLDRMVAAGVARPDEVLQAKAEPVPERKPMPVLAAHAADEAVTAAPERKLHRLTIDANLQEKLEELARDRARELGPEVSVSMVVIERAEVLARVGSPNYFDERRAGQIDMTRAVRSPGSALKPFIYGMAFEDGLIHPETFIDDRPVRYGGYAPANFDLTFQGTVTARRALQLSLNLPAIAILDAVGPARFSARLKQAGASLALPAGDAPGLPIALGGVGITLFDLTRLYSGFAGLGVVAPIRENLDEPSSGEQLRLLDPVAAWYVGNILIGTPPPENALAGRIAFKTGTSYGYRDAWTVGFDGSRTIGVWVGRPDGTPVPGMVGRGAAAPILFDAFARMNRPVAALPPPPHGALISASANLPPPLRRFGAMRLGNGVASPALRILFPPEGAQIELSRRGSERDLIALKISGGIAPLTVLVNGVPAATATSKRSLMWEPDGPGFVRLTVTDARGAADSVVVRVR
jgi:penicillin-binding protein 1C